MPPHANQTLTAAMALTAFVIIDSAAAQQTANPPAEPVSFPLVSATSYKVGDTITPEVTFQVNQSPFPPDQTGTQVECCNSADTPCNFALYAPGNKLVLVAKGVLQGADGNDIKGTSSYTFPNPPMPPTQYALALHYECVIATYQKVSGKTVRQWGRWTSGEVPGWLIIVSP